MRIALISLLALSVSTASAQSLCVNSYQKAHAKYFSKIEELDKQQSALRAGGIAIGTVGVWCLFRTRHLGVRASILTCAGLLGTAFVGSQAYRHRILGQMKELQDAYKIYEVY